MTTLISADSHVAVSPGAIRERVPRSLRETFDDAMAAQAKIAKDLNGGRKALSLDDFDVEAIGDPGYRSRSRPAWPPWTRDGVRAEVLYSELSAFRAFGLVKGDWKPISRAFTEHMADFAATDPNRLAVSYQVPLIDIRYAVTEVERLAGLGARSVHLPNFPSEVGLPDYHEAVYDPLWGVLQETGISISHHLGNRHWLYDIFRRDPTPQAAVFTSIAVAAGPVGGDRLVAADRNARAASPPQDRLRRAQPLLGARLPGPAGPQGQGLRPARGHREAERRLPPQHVAHLHGRRGRAPAAAHDRRREHPVVDGLPPPGHHLAELAGSGCPASSCGIPDAERDLICSGNATRVYGLA